MIKFPRNDSKYRWTAHIKDKMIFYRLSEQKIKTVIKNPDRKEEGIAPKTFALMRRNDTPKRKEEIWVMYAGNFKKIMISAWRYPGKSKPGKEIPIPAGIEEEILEEIKKGWFS